MTHDVEMPSLGYGMEEGTIARWTKSVGDRVDRGEPIAEIDTDKATVEMEALRSGVLVEIVQPAGATVSVGSVIARIDDGGES